MNLFSAFVIVGLFTGRSVDSVGVFKGVMTAIKVVSFGLDVYSFFDSIFSEEEVHSTPSSVDYDRIINGISERIEISSDTIIFKIELHSYISELRDVALTIKHLLSEMEDIIKADSTEKREEYKSRFSTNYALHKLKIYRIKSLLTFTVDVSGFSYTLQALIANEFECEMTRLEEFQNYYMTLVSDVVALALLNEKLAKKSLYNDTLAYWKGAVKSLIKDMNEQKDICRPKFLVQKDLDRISDPSQLFENYKERYNNITIDVLFLSGSYCVWNLKKYGNILKQKLEKTATFVFINTKENQATHNKEQYLKIASATKFKECLKETGKILSYFDDLGEDLVFWLMFPKEKATSLKILLHQNSYARKIEISSDGTRYTALFYVRAQGSTLTADNFDAMFNEETAHVEEKNKEESFLKTWSWRIWVLIGGPVLVVIICSLLFCLFGFC